ncbi:hypothetical protein R5R35_002046 [Gryllus longicercus]|uniref:PHD-type domain-containing protein n=1 Tax=Gryllus longicercus TaxID=2509291 RepID=A0AAN9Z0F8_9ORTH
MSNKETQRIQDDEEENNTCTVCSEKITDTKFATCDSCKATSHYICSDICTTEQRCFELKSKRRMKFFCLACEKGMSILPEVLSSITSMKAEITKLTEMITKNKSEANTLENQGHTAVIENAIEELSIRQLKSKNIILHNVKESTQDVATKRQEDDRNEATKIFKSFNEVCPDIVMTTRLGKQTDTITKPRPLRIVLKDSSQVLNILKRKELYTGPIQFSSDKTQQQRNHLKFLNSEVERLNREEGIPTKIIKYINGFPKIINKPQAKSKKGMTQSQATQSTSSTKM